MIEYKGLRFSEFEVYNMMDDGFGYYEALEKLYQKEVTRQRDLVENDFWKSISTCA